MLVLLVLYRRLDPAAPGSRALAAAAVAAPTPLCWFTASRPLSDTAGLTAALAAQALTFTANGPRALAAAGLIAAIGVGIRSQVAWLTLPLQVAVACRFPPGRRGAAVGSVAAGWFIGGLLWGVPLLVLTGRPSAYLTALLDQGAENLTGVRMLWTTPTPRVAAEALFYALVAPWGWWPLAVVVLLLGVVGGLVVIRRSQQALVALTGAFGPYRLFDLLFQEAT